jgi:hypothetical protein
MKLCSRGARGIVILRLLIFTGIMFAYFQVDFSYAFRNVWRVIEEKACKQQGGFHSDEEKRFSDLVHSAFFWVKDKGGVER